MIKIFKNRDFWLIFLLNLLLFAGFLICYGHGGKLLEDCGREAFLPTVALDKNLVMYRDIFNLYPPLSYQFNGLLFKIFGENLNVLYIAGFLNTTVIVSVFYLLTRFFLNKILSFSMVFFFIFYNILGYFAYSIEFFFPYSFAYIYALSSFLISLLFFVKFLKKRNNIKFIYLSFFFMGISVANKFEFALTPIIYIITLCLLKQNFSFSEKIKTFLSFFSVPCLSYGYLFFQGLTFSDIYNYINFGRRFFATDTYKAFSTPVSYSLIYGILAFFLYFCGFLPLIFILKKSLNITKTKRNFMTILFTLLGLFVFYIFYSMQVFSFSWICYSSLLMAIYIILKKYYKNDYIFLMLLIVFIFSATKFHFQIIKNSYGNYLMSFFIFLNIVFLQKYCQKLISKIDFTKLTAIILISTSLLTGFARTCSAYYLKPYKIDTPKGFIYVNENLGKSFNSLIEYVNTNIPKDATVLVLQEGIMLNFLTDRKTNLRLYHLIKIHVETLGEKYIIEELKQNPPDYIIEIYTDNISKPILDYISENYKNQTMIDFISVLKKNN